MENPKSQEYIAKELVKYNLPDAKIAEMKAAYMPLIVKDIEDMDNYLACREAHQEVKKIRVAIENKRKELKVSSLEFGKAVDAEAKRLTVGVVEVENHLLAQRRVVEDEKKRIQEEKERKEREEAERLQREEEERLEAIRKEQEEREKKLQEEQEKIETQKRANEAEKARLQAEKDKQEQEKIEAEEAKKRAEREAIEQEKRKKEEATERTKREKRHAEEVRQAEKDAAERAIREREEREEAEKLKAEKAKLLAPDKEKILLYGEEIGLVLIPQVKTREARTILDELVPTIQDALNTFKNKVNKL